ncbi:MAG: hypothetical protein Q9164_007653, partial [Protoblastenia rupestris]
MLKTKAGDRSSAKACFQRALELFQDDLNQPDPREGVRTPVLTGPLWKNVHSNEELSTANEATYSQRRNRKSTSSKSSNEKDGASKRQRVAADNSRRNLEVSAAREQVSPILSKHVSRAGSIGSVLGDEAIHGEDFVPSRDSAAPTMQSHGIWRRSNGSFAPALIPHLDRLPNDQLQSTPDLNGTPVCSNGWLNTKEAREPHQLHTEADKAYELRAETYESHPPRAEFQVLTEVTVSDAQYVQITVDNKPVLMRKEDFFLNVTQIANLAGKNLSERQRLFGLLKKTTTVDVCRGKNPLPSVSSWVNFYFGQALCNLLGLEQKLQSLLDYGRRWKPGYSKDAQQLINGCLNE